MFKLECFVDDKKVGDALRALLGIAIGMPIATPVVNAELRDGRIKAQSSGVLPQRFLHYLQQAKIDSVRPQDIKVWLQNQGMSPSSYSYVIKYGIRAGVLRRTGMSSRVVYYVIKALPKPASKPKEK